MHVSAVVYMVRALALSFRDGFQGVARSQPPLRGSSETGWGQFSFPVTRLSAEPFRGPKQRGPILARAEAELPASVGRFVAVFVSSTQRVRAPPDPSDVPCEARAFPGIECLSPSRVPPVPSGAHPRTLSAHSLVPWVTETKVWTCAIDLICRAELRFAGR